MEFQVAERGYLENMMVDPECAADAFEEPSLQKWAICVDQMANYRMVSGSIGLVVVLTIIIIIMSVFEVSGLAFFGTLLVGGLLLGANIVSNLMWKSGAGAEWRQKTAMMSRMMSDPDVKYNGSLTDEDLKNYDNLPADKQKEVKKQRWELVKLLRARQGEIQKQKNEQAIANAQVRQAQGVALVGVGQSLQGVAAIGSLFRSR